MADDDLPHPPRIRTSCAPAVLVAPLVEAADFTIAAHHAGAPLPGFVLSGAELYDAPKPATQAHRRFAAASGSSSPGSKSATVGGARPGGGSSGGGTGALPQSATVKRQPIVWGKRTPLRKDASWFALSVLLWYTASVAYYLYVRIALTLDLPRGGWYSIAVLVVEAIGISAVLPYGLMNVCHTHPTGSLGLPPDDGLTAPDKTFTLRVLVPCYAEPLAVVSATVTAAMEAALPPGVTRHLYLCDDGKDASKKAWLEQAFAGDDANGRVHYVSGRTRKKGEINGKSANLNSALAAIYAGADPAAIPPNELVVVFDADMQAKPSFFCKLLEVMVDDSIALVLSPQAFSNVDAATDVFNNTNQQFWEYCLPGLNALGYIACTGTNFVVRARALGSVGWFPEWCITEDYALSMELKAAGFKGAYLAEYLAVGEAPAELRNILRQRSRWAKGHFQVFFSMRSPLLRWRLPLLHRLLYINGTWAYFASVVSTWTFLLVPLLSLLFELQPVRFSHQFALAATLYLVSGSAVMNYFHVAAHLRGAWLASVSNNLLAFTYAKALWNTLLSKARIKPKAGFKATEKGRGGGGGAALQIQAALMTRLTSITRRFNAATLPQLYAEPTAAPAAAGSKAKAQEDECVSDKVVMALCLSICLNTMVLGLHEAYARGGLTAWVALPILWAVYNAVPPLLFFGYLFLKPGRASFENACFYLQLTSIAASFGAVVCLWFVAPVVY